MDDFVLALLGAASANGFQLVTSAVQSKAMSDFQITNIQVGVSNPYNLKITNSLHLEKFHKY